MNWLFYLDDTVEIEEPGGFDNLEISIKRHDSLHGMVFAASLSSLEFFGVAYSYLKNKKETDGIKASVKFTAYATCDTYDYQEVLSGRLNFGKYKENCGNQCTISLPWEEESCEIILKSREDQKIDIDKTSAINGITPLESYAALNQSYELPAHEIKVATEGYVADEGDEIDLSIFPPLVTIDFSVRPTYSNQLFSNINESQLVPAVFASSSNGLNDSAISPVILLAEEIDCFQQDFDYEVRMKGSYNILYNLIGSEVTNVRLMVAKGEYPGSLTILHEQVLSFSEDDAIGTFDYTFTGSTPLNQGDGFYTWFGFEGEDGASHNLTGSVTFDKETYINIGGTRSCPPTNSALYMVHETLSRLTESITNGCMRVKSSYYGRTDSQPFSFPEDGCGGLRTVTSGLKIRNAEQPKFFTSIKELIDGLNAIDNIGYEVRDDDTMPGNKLLVVESVDYFYQDSEVLSHDAVPSGSKEIEEGKHYAKIDVGYKDWEVEEVNGLDEFNSTRQYNTSFETVKTTLDITSGLVAGTYPIEITRQQSFAVTGAADTKYDNKVFIICMKRDDYPYGSISVEQGNIDNPQNIFSPSTIYNYRISPVRNLMRWFKSIAAGFMNLGDTTSKLFFISGTGNFSASGKMSSEGCRLEAGEISEGQNLYITNFADPSDATPIWKPETNTYEYAMSFDDYKKVKANPYGYISSQCGNGEVVKYWIQEIKYKLAKGRATFVLREKYTQ